MRRVIVSSFTTLSGVIAIAEACNLSRENVSLPSGKKVSTRWVLAFFSEYPLDLASLDDLMALENPMVLESMGGSDATADGTSKGAHAHGIGV